MESDPLLFPHPKIPVNMVTESLPVMAALLQLGWRRCGDGITMSLHLPPSLCAGAWSSGCCAPVTHGAEQLGHSPAESAGPAGVSARGEGCLRELLRHSMTWEFLDASAPEMGVQVPFPQPGKLWCKHN